MLGDEGAGVGVGAGAGDEASVEVPAGTYSASVAAAGTTEPVIGPACHDDTRRAAEWYGLRARGLLPSGPLGARALEEIAGEVAPYACAFREWHDDAEATSLLLDVEVDGVRVHGRLADVLPQGIARLRFGKPNGPSSIRNGLDWLLATAAGVALPFVEFHEDPDDGVGPHLRPPLSRESAIDALHALVALRRDGLRRPLPFAPYSGWDLFTAATPERGIQAAANRWRGSQRSWAEGDSEALRLTLRGRDPFADAAALQEFADIAFVIYGALTRGEPMPAPMINADALPDHAEDEA